MKNTRLVVFFFVICALCSASATVAKELVFEVTAKDNIVTYKVNTDLTKQPHFFPNMLSNVKGLQQLQGKKSEFSLYHSLAVDRETFLRAVERQIAGFYKWHNTDVTFFRKKMKSSSWFKNLQDVLERTNKTLHKHGTIAVIEKRDNLIVVHLNHRVAGSEASWEIQRQKLQLPLHVNKRYLLAFIRSKLKQEDIQSTVKQVFNKHWAGKEMHFVEV